MPDDLTGDAESSHRQEQDDELAKLRRRQRELKERLADLGSRFDALKDAKDKNGEKGEKARAGNEP